MRKVIDDPRLMIKVCDLYYNRDVSRQEICRQLGLSRPTVARLLEAARAQGIVQIRIPDLDVIRHWELEKELEKRFGLRQAVVADAGDTREELEQSLGKAAARYLRYVIRDGSTVGISMGSTLCHMVSALEERGWSEKCGRVTFVPLVGGMGRLRMELHANSLAERMSRVCGGSFIPLHAPARVSGRLVREELMKEESFAPAIDAMGRLDLALVGIGYPGEHSAIQATGYFKEHEIESLIRRKAAGELCMQFYDEQGDTAPYRSDNLVIGADIHRLRKVQVSAGIAGGLEKLPAIRGAIHGKYINTLITDVRCAQALVSDKEVKEDERDFEHDHR